MAEQVSTAVRASTVRRARVVALVVGAAVLLAACGGEADGSASSAGSAPGRGGSVTVFAAASLTDAFIEVGAAFEAAHPGTTVELSFAGSSSLREQILSGAPADVFASADPATMDQVVAGGEAAEATTFAANRLQIVVPAGNGAGISDLADFADEDLLLGLCTEEVPCGRYAREALAAAGVEPSVDTEELDVRALLTKVEAGELDAGIVYVTDVLAAGDQVEGIDIPDEEDVTASYPIAALTEADDAELARAFVAFVLAAEGQAILGSFGFEGP